MALYRPEEALGIPRGAERILEAQYSNAATSENFIGQAHAHGPFQPVRTTKKNGT